MQLSRTLYIIICQNSEIRYIVDGV